MAGVEMQRTIWSDLLPALVNLRQQLASKISSNQRIGRIIVLLLLLNVLKGILFLSIVPIWKAPDEPGYFAYTEVLVEEKRIPKRTESLPTEIKERYLMRAAGHPPLYPIVSALPYILLKPLGLKYQVLAIRLLGVIFGTIVVLLGFMIMEALFPNDAFLQLLVPAFLVFSPQLSFITASVNSDGLLILLFSLFLYQMVQIIQHNFTWQRILGLVVIVAAGLFTKQRFLVALPPLVIVVGTWLFMKVIEFARKVELLQLLKRAIALRALSLVALISGVVLFLAVRFHSLVARLSSAIWERVFPSFFLLSPKVLSSMLLQRNFVPRMFRQFWGYFGWLEIPLPQLAYEVLKWITVLCGVGWALLALKAVQKTHHQKSQNKAHFGVATSFITLSFLAFVSLLTVFATAHYDLTAGGGQGRYLFISIIPMFIFYSLGIRGLCLTEGGEKGFFISVFLGLFALNIISLFYVIVPFYYG